MWGKYVPPQTCRDPTPLADGSMSLFTDVYAAESQFATRRHYEQRNRRALETAEAISESAVSIIAATDGIWRWRRVQVGRVANIYFQSLWYNSMTVKQTKSIR